jgi:hypothetical protein
MVSLCYFLFVRERNSLLALAGANGFFSSGQFAWMTIYLPDYSQHACGVQLGL